MFSYKPENQFNLMVSNNYKGGKQCRWKCLLGEILHAARNQRTNEKG